MALYLVCFSVSGWFGIRKDFCQFILGMCPCLQEYGNISYSVQSNSDIPTDSVTVKTIPSKRTMLEEQPKVVMPIISIETPDWHKLFLDLGKHFEQKVQYCCLWDQTHFFKQQGGAHYTPGGMLELNFMSLRSNSCWSSRFVRFWLCQNLTNLEFGHSYKPHMRQIL